MRILYTFACWLDEKMHDAIERNPRNMVAQWAHAQAHNLAYACRSRSRAK